METQQWLPGYLELHHCRSKSLQAWQTYLDFLKSNYGDLALVGGEGSTGAKLSIDARFQNELVKDLLAHVKKFEATADTDDYDFRLLACQATTQTFSATLARVATLSARVIQNFVLADLGVTQELGAESTSKYCEIAIESPVLMSSSLLSLGSMLGHLMRIEALEIELNYWDWQGPEDEDFRVKAIELMLHDSTKELTVAQKMVEGLIYPVFSWALGLSSYPTREEIFAWIHEDKVFSDAVSR